MLNRRNFLGSATTLPFAAASSPAAEAAMNRSYDVKAEINPELKAHGAIFERKIHRIGDNVYSAVGWSGCNTIAVVGSDGIIIVDTGTDLQSAQEVATELRKMTDKPARAIIYTCFHLDHIGGVKGFASDADVKQGRVAIIAHETFLANVIRQGRTIAPALGARTAYNFGNFLEGADIEGMNNGTGPLPRRNVKASFIAPTMTFAKTLDITIAGIAMHLVHVPSEAADEIAVFLPESRTLLSSEVIPAQHFPALHPLRGEAYRDPVAWYRSIDLLRGFKAAAMVPSHGLPVIGEDKVEEVLRNYRDAIQFVHDQTVRHMNKALVPDELAETIRLPPHLADYKPWLQEFFGSVSQSVRAIYQGYLGWFEGDPIALAPLPRVERARREIDAMGGRERVLAVAQTAFDDADLQWSAELATRLIRADRSDTAARQLKAAAFRRLGYAQINATWRNWYLSAARELEGFDFVAYARNNVAAFVSPDLIMALPAKAFLETLTTRLKAEDTLEVTMTVGFSFPDVGEAYYFRLRRGVAEVDENLAGATDLTLTLDKAVLDRIQLGQLTMRNAIESGLVKASQGAAPDAFRFFGYFEAPLATPIQLVTR